MATSAGNDDVLKVIKEHRRSLVMYASGDYAVKLDNKNNETLLNHNNRSCDQLNNENTKKKGKRIKDHMNKCKVM